MSVTVDSNGVTLTGDGWGVNWARKQLAAAPSTAVKMQFVYRCYFTDNSSTEVAHSAKGWDSASFLGLGFDNTIYDFSAADTLAPATFFGLATTAKPYTTGPAYDNSRKVYDAYNFGVSDVTIIAAPWGTASSVTQPVAMFDGIGTALNTTTDYSSTAWINALTTFPHNATKGAQATFMWEVWGSSIDNSVYMRRILNMASLAEGDAMFTAMDGATVGTSYGNIYENTIHGDTTSNWRNADGTMNFPRWLKFKCSLPDMNLRLKYFKIRYLDANDTVVS